MEQEDFPHTEKVIIHHLHWRGPFDLEDVEKEGWEKNNGIYQIYGTHPTEGASSLLYIGQNTTEFGHRLSFHKKWLRKEYDRPKVHLGRLVDEEKVKPGTLEEEPYDQGKLKEGESDFPFLDDENNGSVSSEDLMDALRECEAMLIYYCAPPYNTQNLNSPSMGLLENRKEASATILYNTGRMGKLPVEVSSLWYKRWYLASR